ncbi:MAG: class I SAM-dependent methyltransferase [Patescibacteria group bacterium]|mgnify:CR=1 FL=1
MTNVMPVQLNYSRYTGKKYDQDIVNAIPFHKEIHNEIVRYVASHYDPKMTYQILDLGVGTGITAAIVRDLLPCAHFDVIDFSEHMLEGARKRLGYSNTTFINGDYSTFRFRKKYDIIISVIGIHHQQGTGKKKLFKKIYSLLKSDGVFLFGDLMTSRNPRVAALNHVLHYHHLVENAVNRKTLSEWAHHHMFLNNLSPIEDQEEWLHTVGFAVQRLLSQWNTALLICKKRNH